jgi:peptidyl-prolyl cis-trans isomerase D
MMGDLRKKITKVLVSILFGLLILSFAVWGIGDIFRGQTGGTSVVRVGEQQIDQLEFQNILQRQASNLRQRLGSDITLEDLRSLGLVDRILQDLITRSLFEEKARLMDLAVPEQQIAAEIQQQAAFQGPTGRFDPNQFRFFLRNAGLTEQGFIAELRGDIQRERLVRAVGSGVAAPVSLAERLFAYRNETRVARFAEIPFEPAEAIPEPDKETLVEYYEQNPAAYEAPEYRAVTLVQLRPQRLAEEVAISEEELRDAFENRKGEFETPERRNVRQIVFEDRETAAAAMEQLREGLSFEAVAEETTGNEPVDLGMVARGDLPEDLADTAFAVEEGEIGGPAQSDFGWHIMEVSDVQPGKSASFEEVKEELRRDLALREAFDDVVSIANQLDDELAGGATLEQAAASLGLEVRKIPAISQSGTNPLGEAVKDIPAVGEIAPVIFETQSGEQSLLHETSAGGYFVLRVDGVQPPDIRPFEEVRDQVLGDWLTERRAERARERAEAIAQKVRDGQDFADAVQAAGLEPRTSDPIGRQDNDPAGTGATRLTALLFDLDLKDVTSVVAADKAVVAQLAEIRPADPAEAPDEVAGLREQLTQSIAGDLVGQFGNALQAEIEVAVNQRLLEELLSRY